MVKGSQEYQHELKSSYLTLFEDSRPEKNTEPRVDQHSDSEISAEHNDGSSGSSSGDEGLNPAVPPTRPEKRMMTFKDKVLLNGSRSFRLTVSHL
ncbi:hypothetical protein ACF0H5_000320 [Mactra antiquata]